MWGRRIHCSFCNCLYETQKDFYKDYKETVVNKALHSNFENFSFRPEQFIPKNEVQLLTNRQPFSYQGED